MIKTQRIIKYCAIAFAIFLICNIISAIFYGLVSIGSIFNENNTNDNEIQTDNLKELNIKEKIKRIDIDVKDINIIVKENTDFKIETNNKYINTKENNNKLSITENNLNWFNNNNTTLIIHIPLNYTFEDVSIDNGAGKIEIEMLNSKKLELNLGAGQVNINNLNITNECDIDGGAGEVIVKNSKINNLDLDMGVGKVTLNTTLIGNNEINAGVGELNIDLIGSSDEYKIRLNKGIGNAKLNDENMKNDTYYGNGTNLVDIDGGIGNIEINYSR